MISTWTTCRARLPDPDGTSGINRRALLKHLRGTVRRRALPSREALAALALVGGVLALTVTHAFVVP